MYLVEESRSWSIQESQYLNEGCSYQWPMLPYVFLTRTFCSVLHYYSISSSFRFDEIILLIHLTNIKHSLSIPPDIKKTRGVSKPCSTFKALFNIIFWWSRFLLPAKVDLFGKQKIDFKQLKPKKSLKHVWQLIIRTSNATLEVPLQRPWNPC